MAKRIVVSHGGERVELDFAKIDRDKLYGRKERVVVDAEGRPCTPAYLSSDGAALVPSGGLSFLYVDATQNTIDRAQLATVDANGAPVLKVASTLDVEQPLEGPVPPSRLLDHTVTAVYALEPAALPASLAERLRAGEVFETRFVHREDVAAHALFLVQNEAGLFGLVADPHGFGFVADEASSVEPDEGDDADEPLDFGMM